MVASAAVAAAIALAGCNTDDITPTGRSQAPLAEKMISEISSKNMEKDSPILARIFKEEAELEIWKQDRNGQYALLKTYPICRWSGDLGPKKKEGDRQAPEGFYTITPGQMNPVSNYYLAFNTGFPNAYDRAWGYTGSELMVHGDCSSRGCYAMTDEQIQEIYALARESFFGGQKAFQLEAFPFRMTALNMAKHRNNPNFAFWKMLKQGYDHFEATRQEPRVAVCEKRYVFDPAAPDNASHPLSFNARGKCPIYQVDKNIADVVLDHQRKEQYQMAKYIAEGVATVPPRHDVDGGMNPVFADKIVTQPGYDSKGHPILVATAPGALPRDSYSDRPAPIVSVPKPVETGETTPVVLASVPMPQPAPEPKIGVEPPQKSKSIAGLIGNMFSGGNAQAEVAADNEGSQPAENSVGKPVALRGSKSETAKHRAPVQAATHPKPHAVAAAKPKIERNVAPNSVANNAPKPRPAPAPSEAAPSDTQEMRTAYSTPPARTNGLLAGAQPVMPVGTFDSRWSGLR
jgi:murein L,D-transpeptidase YafK